MPDAGVFVRLPLTLGGSIVSCVGKKKTSLKLCLYICTRTYIYHTCCFRQIASNTILYDLFRYFYCYFIFLSLSVFIFFHSSFIEFPVFSFLTSNHVCPASPFPYYCSRRYTCDTLLFARPVSVVL